jgi:hypothetical protein
MGTAQPFFCAFLRSCLKNNFQDTLINEKVAGGDTGHGGTPLLRPTNRNMKNGNFIFRSF